MTLLISLPATDDPVNYSTRNGAEFRFCLFFFLSCLICKPQSHVFWACSRVNAICIDSRVVIQHVGLEISWPGFVCKETFFEKPYKDPVPQWVSEKKLRKVRWNI